MSDVQDAAHAAKHAVVTRAHVESVMKRFYEPFFIL